MIFAPPGTGRGIFRISHWCGSTRSLPPWGRWPSEARSDEVPAVRIRRRAALEGTACCTSPGPCGAADCQASATLSAKISAGVFQPRHFLGRLLISSSTNWISLSVIFLKSKPFGKKNLTISFVFSFVPRCQGL